MIFLDLVKKHLRVEIDDCFEDDLIELAIQSAVKEAENYCEIDFQETYGDDLPADIKSALLLLIADRYDKRENRKGENVSAARLLLNPYRKWH